MGYYSFYFLAKLLLYATGHLDFHVGLNLALAAFTALPAANPRLRLAKNALAVPLSVMLLYYDSWWPPLRRVLAQWQGLSEFSGPYLAELALRIVDLRVLAALLAGFALYVLLRRKLRFGTFAVLGIVAVALVPAPAPTSDLPPAAAPGARAPRLTAAATSPARLEAELGAFYAREAARSAPLPGAVSGAPFDVILLHVCSLAWADLAAVGLATDPLLARFDLLFTRFNSAASYSGPAAIRLLRGNCGQTPHRALYSEVAPGCFVLGGLERAGFEPHWLMNHDGHFGNFFADVRTRGGLAVAPEATPAAAVAARAFDGSPVLDDYAVLAGWWQRRLASGVPRVVLYYNTISLHDGNQLVGAARTSGRASFGARTHRLFSDLGRFLDLLAASGRHVVVVLVPEHGAAVAGEPRQIEGLREVPSPAITQVPVAVAFLGAAQHAPPRRLEGPVSYLALATLLARATATDPFAAAAVPAAALSDDLPATAPVAENEGTIVLSSAGTAWLRSPDGSWSAWGAAPQ